MKSFCSIRRHARQLLGGLVLALFCGAAAALPTPVWTSEQASPGAVALIKAGHATPLYVANEDWPAVRRAVGDLRQDFAHVGGHAPAVAAAPTGAQTDAVIVGTLGHSALIDALVAAGKLDAAALRGRWEGFAIATVDAPLPGIARALVIAGSDMRGTIYGVYELSQQIGVSPWVWWADVPVQLHATLYAPAGLRANDAPVVQYRGIFLNDEQPALSGWVQEHYGKYDHRFYARLFELILRLRGNYLWPAMWGASFFADDPENGATAAAYGVVIGTSHHEPLMRAHNEWDARTMGPWDYAKNGAALREFWAGGLRQSRDAERVITVGMRGDGDEPMSAANDIPLLERIVADQRKIIAGEPDAATAPQVWALYKEVQSYYEQGMRVPDDVTLLWSDDNWGHLRRLPTPDERRRKGGAGIYYHLDYVGGPRDYKWLNVTPLPKIREQMALAAQTGATKMWIVNVGDLKPMEVPTEFFLSLAWNPAAIPADGVDAWLRQWAAREFGAQHADAIAAMVAAYAHYNGRRKPELLSPDTYSLANYREAETVAGDYRRLAERAEALYRTLPHEQRDAFFELVLYPVEACATVNEIEVAVALNRFYARQGRASANAEGERARRLFAADAEWTRRYNRELAGGKWNHQMDQTHLGYYAWSDPPLNALPPITEVQPHEGADMAVAVEGDAQPSSWSSFGRGARELALPALDAFEAGRTRRIEVFNRGTAPFKFTASASAPWVTLSSSSGTVTGQQAIEVGVRWAEVPADAHEARVTLAGDDGRRFVVRAPLVARRASAGLTGFVETGGVVAIEAEHYDAAVAPSGRAWTTVPGLGGTLSGVSAGPVTAAGASEPDMHLDYRVNLFEAGTVKVVATLAPTQAFFPGHGLRFAVSFDDAAPQIVDMHADRSEAHWDQSVMDEAVRFTTTHVIASPGAHVLKFWALDPGVVVTRLVVDAGGLEPSYLGPPESPRLELKD